MKVLLLVVPYDTAQRGWRMGAGPEHLLELGLVRHLESLGHQVTASTIHDDADLPPAEIRTAFELARRIAVRVRLARAAGEFPLILAGNCASAIGTLSGLAPDRRAAFWFDAHGDLNTPSTTTTGFLDGTSLATCLGNGFSALAASVPGFTPIAPDDVVLIGARDFDPAEKAYLAQAPVLHVAPPGIRRLDQVLAGADYGDAVGYVHCDLDVLDPSEGQANCFPVPGGLRVDEMIRAIELVKRRVPVGAAAITAYAPSFDEDGAVGRAALKIAAALVHE